MNEIKKHTIKIFKNDFQKLQDKEIKDFYFTEPVTKKHINNLKTLFYDIINNIKNDNDIINLFKISESNNKLNKTNLKINTISLAPYYLCNNLLNNNCNNCRICYGAKNERFKNIIKYRLNNYIYFTILEYLRIKDFNRYIIILYNTIDLNKNKLTGIIRVNQQSDIKNNTILYILNDILRYIKMNYNKNCIFYTYSKTKNLNFNKINKDFIINQSISLIKDPAELLKFKNSTNIFITIDNNITTNQLNDLNINYYMCRGTCGSCRNCFKTNKHITLCYKH